MFETDPKARTDLSPGTLYAVTGENNWIYYGQVTPKKSVGFFNFRDLKLTSISTVLSSQVMSVITVVHPSIGRALRSGHWKKLGRFDIVQPLLATRKTVQWPVGTTTVTVWEGDLITNQTRVEDPDVQALELIAAWDAIDHIPARLTADFGVEEAEWHIGGPIFRERKIKEEFARRFPDVAHHQLPADWVRTD